MTMNRRDFIKTAAGLAAVAALPAAATAAATPMTGFPWSLTITAKGGAYQRMGAIVSILERQYCNAHHMVDIFASAEQPSLRRAKIEALPLTGVPADYWDLRVIATDLPAIFKEVVSVDLHHEFAGIILPKPEIAVLDEYNGEVEFIVQSTEIIRYVGLGALVEARVNIGNGNCMSGHVPHSPVRWALGK